MLSFSPLNTKCYLVLITSKTAKGTVLLISWIGKLSLVDGIGGVPAQRPDQGERSGTSVRLEVRVDYERAGGREHE